MPLSEAQRQKRYRNRKKSEGVKRYQVMLPQTVAEHVRELTQEFNCTKGELFSQLIEQEYSKLTNNQP